VVTCRMAAGHLEQPKIVQEADLINSSDIWCCRAFACP
jgi:hypothetical protein